MKLDKHRSFCRQEIVENFCMDYDDYFYDYFDLVNLPKQTYLTNQIF